MCIRDRYYIEAQFTGSQIELFINGVSQGTAATSTTPQQTNFHIGTLGSSWDSSYEIDGYVSDLRVVSGTPSGSSTIPTGPVSSSGTALHIKGTEASIIDKSQRYNISLGSSAIVRSSTTKWSGQHSIFIDSRASSSNLITIPAGVLDASQPFTIEMWLNTLYGSTCGFWGIYQDSANEMRLKMRSDDRLEFYHSGSNWNDQITAASATLNTTDFYHIAVTRDANAVFYLHQNGIKLGNFTGSNYKLKDHIWENFNWEVDKCVLRSDNNPIKNNI